MRNSSNTDKPGETEFPAGALISNRYRVVKKLGKGGYGTVYEVEHVDLGKPFALKVLTHKEGRQDEKIERLRREAISTSKIAHPNIVTVTDFGTTPGGQIYYVMELLKGQTLTKLLAQVRTFSLSRALPILISTCHALHSAHKLGVVHRDLKPGNIFIIPMEDVQRGIKRDFVKVLDFGLAKVMELVGQISRLTIDGKTVGTPGYAAPEQLEGREVDHRVDIYSVGCIAFEMFAGKPVFSGKAMRVMMDHLETPAPLVRQRNATARIPDQMERLIDRCLQKDPDLRFATCAEVLQEMREVARIMLTPEGSTWVGAYEKRAEAPGDADEWGMETTDRFWWEQLSTASIEMEREAVLEAMARAASNEKAAEPEAHEDSSDDMEGVGVTTGVGREAGSSEEVTAIQGLQVAKEQPSDSSIVDLPVKPFHVVLVENDEVLGEEISNVLSEYGYTVRQIEARGALDTIRAVPPDLIIISVELHRSSGYTICNQVKQDPDLKRIPLILMSFDATGAMFDFHRTLPTRADGYMVKPFKREQLLQEVASLCSFEERPAPAYDTSTSSKLIFVDGKKTSKGSSRGLSARALRHIVTVLVLITVFVLGLTVYIQLRRRPLASLAIQVSPAAAQVFINGQLVKGQHSLRIVNNLQPGRLRLEVRHPSCSAETREIVVKGGGASAVMVNLDCDRR